MVLFFFIKEENKAFVNIFLSYTSKVMLVGCYITGEQTGRSPPPTPSHPTPSTLGDRDTQRAGSCLAPKGFKITWTEGPADGPPGEQDGTSGEGRSGVLVKKIP